MLNASLCFFNTILLLDIMSNINFNTNITLSTNNRHMYMLKNISQINNEALIMINNLKSNLTIDNADDIFNNAYSLTKDINLILFDYELREFYLSTASLLLFCGMLYVIDLKKLSFLIILIAFWLMVLGILHFTSYEQELKYHYPNYNCYSYNGEPILFIK